MVDPLLLAGQGVTPITPERVIEICGAEPTWVCRRVLETTENEFLADAADWVVARPLGILFIFALAWLANRLIRRAIRRFVEHAQDEGFQRRVAAIRRRTGVAFLDTSATPRVNARRAQRAEAIGAVLRSITTAVIYTVATFMALGELGMNLGPLIASAGIVGVALGFGAQSLVKDFLSGIFMLVEDQFGVGDIVDVGEASGVVEGLSLRTTRIRDVEGTVWHVPNGEIRRVGNKSQDWARALLDIEVGYGSDIEAVSGVIKQVADAMWHEEKYHHEVILEEPEILGVENLGADGIVIRLVVKTRPSEQFRVSRELRQRVKAAFDDARIEIPFPQRTIWHRFEEGTDPTALPGVPAPPGPPGKAPKKT